MRIKEVLLEKGMSAKELAAACGLSEMGMSNIMTGKSQPNANTIVRIAQALNVSCGELFDDYQAESKANRIVCPKCGCEMKIKVE